MFRTIRVFLPIRVWAIPYAYGLPICVWAILLVPYAYGCPIRVWESPYAYGFPIQVYAYGIAHTSHSEMVNMFNEFSSVFTCEDDFMPEFLTDDSPSTIDSLTITPQLVLNKLTNLKSGKSPGPDGWPTEVIKITAESICLPLSILYNKSLNYGILPDDWKKAYITPLHKKGARNLVSNYRPVSLTSNIVKIMESIVKDNILQYLLANDLISPNQYGFFPGRSCSTQLLSIMDYFTESLDIGYGVDAIYLDFQKVFDSVPHKRLLSKLVSFR